MDHKVAKPHEYLLITGPGIHDIKVEKEATILTGQTCTVFDLSPIPYPVNVLAYSSDKLALLLPVTLTVGPGLDNKQSLLKYATLLTPHNYSVSNYIQAAIEGQTRVLAASMKIDDIFNNFQEFKTKLFGKLKSELKLFGMVIYLADFKDIKKLSDIEIADLKDEFGLQDEVDSDTLTKLGKLYSEFYNKVYDSAAELYRKQKLAEAELYKQEKEAEAERYIKEKEAEGERYRKEKEAEAQRIEAEAEVFYLQTLLDALRGDYAALKDYITINKRVHDAVAKFNPEVVSSFMAKMNDQVAAGDVKTEEAIAEDVEEKNDSCCW